MDRYAREGGGPVAEEGIPSLVTHTPRPPNEVGCLTRTDTHFVNG